MAEQSQKQMIKEIHETSIRLSTVLLGIPDTEETGLVGEVKQLRVEHNNLETKHHKLSTRVKVLIALLIASGVLSGSSFLLNGG